MQSRPRLPVPVLSGSFPRCTAGGAGEEVDGGWDTFCLRVSNRSTPRPKRSTPSASVLGASDPLPLRPRPGPAGVDATGGGGARRCTRRPGGWRDGGGVTSARNDIGCRQLPEYGVGRRVARTGPLQTGCPIDTSPLGMPICAFWLPAFIVSDDSRQRRCGLAWPGRDRKGYKTEAGPLRDFRRAGS